MDTGEVRSSEMIDLGVVDERSGVPVRAPRGIGYWWRRFVSVRVSVVVVLAAFVLGGGAGAYVGHLWTVQWQRQSSAGQVTLIAAIGLREWTAKADPRQRTTTIDGMIMVVNTGSEPVNPRSFLGLAPGVQMESRLRGPVGRPGHHGADGDDGGC